IEVDVAEDDVHVMSPSWSGLGAVGVPWPPRIGVTRSGAVVRLGQVRSLVREFARRVLPRLAVGTALGGVFECFVDELTELGVALRNTHPVRFIREGIAGQFELALVVADKAQ